MRINEYKIKDNITFKLLEEIGFTNYSSNSLHYTKTLYGPITLNITIPVINSNIDLNNIKIRVLDEEILQPYIPFYHITEYKNNNFLEIVILKYNQTMDELVEKGMFENISFREKYHNLIDDTLEKKFLPNPETGDVPRELNLEELAIKNRDDEYLEKYCLSDEQVKRLILIRNNRKNKI